MSRIVKTAMGRKIDMTALMKKNEETIAVSNKNMNARGDILNKERKKIIPVGRVARVQHEMSEPEQSVGISETADPVKATTKRKVAAKKEPEKQIVKKVKKVDDEGNAYYEIEYDDGSIEVVAKDKE